MTKTELKDMAVDDLRTALQEHFEGITEDTTKKEMNALIDEHWEDWLEASFNPVVEEVPVDPETDESEVVEPETVEKDLSAPNPRTDLYSGNLRS